MNPENLKNQTFLYPTDTTFGLGCNANNVEAVQKIFKIKNRPDSKSLIILVDSNQRLQQIVDVPELAWDIMDFSEKPVTIIYDNPRNLSKELIAEDNTIAIRLTKDLFCKKIISKINAPLVSTSANISGEPTPNTFSEISQKIKEEVDYIFPEIETFTPKFTGSSIIKLSADGKVKVIRE
ncbi:L-threonylcarbamoyladenylate synthase [Moheibacter sediminis]|uniref:L-threonylcarbamoyladenylate synthase n=1 Tax=Moheibacter sediminis TaxID=1434700 RepID=A0A1W1ZNF5_9FLAO|nr:L-threonylcarbamoyladenylate synthase [Moheibacter sediminis]SMC49926.1 L-threonylcarbamoyladenylate synthase [Moheibacter sediminis]